MSAGLGADIPEANGEAAANKGDMEGLKPGETPAIALLVPTAPTMPKPAPPPLLAAVQESSEKDAALNDAVVDGNEICAKAMRTLAGVSLVTTNVAVKEGIRKAAARVVEGNAADANAIMLSLPLGDGIPPSIPTPLLLLLLLLLV
jgi:hypothetical protein